MAKSRVVEFPAYLQKAIGRALQDDREKKDNGELKWFLDLCQNGVRQNHENLSATTFLSNYLWAVGSIRKKYSTISKYAKAREQLFRNCDPFRIANEESRIWKEWQEKKCTLNRKMVSAVLSTAKEIARDRAQFRSDYLPLPVKAETETVQAWEDSRRALDRLPMIGYALAWYLIRNLYGAPFFKPDVHILAIADYFYGQNADPIGALSHAVREVWPQVCTDSRLTPIHLGKVDYILWWYRSNTGEP